MEDVDLTWLLLIEGWEGIYSVSELAYFAHHGAKTSNDQRYWRYMNIVYSVLEINMVKGEIWSE